MNAAIAWADMVARASLRMARTGMLAARMLLTVRRALPRWLAGLLVFGALPIPGPVDNVAFIVALAILWFFYRPLLRVCWCAAQLEA